ncbi:nitrogen fixation protein NifQ [Immundisolibacter sp.]|uniref:nitrogen fixation protein NifQ n=1 Tax=Immundisolibacter sp. TaxID=1934948 RepID=UPI0025C5B1C0|nr:nitrogen fixation protein NifQ [Immundisolibacter sp.]
MALAVASGSELRAQDAATRLLAFAVEPGCVPAQAFAGVLAQFGTLCLPAPELQRLAERHFPDAVALVVHLDMGLPKALRQRLDEVDDVRELLLEFRRPASQDATWLASAVAVGCLGDNHLWQDLGLPHRQALSQLLREHFPALCERNTGDMKWKKFLYKQLCERAAVQCRAPSCAVCSDYGFCFGPEEGPTRPVRG